MWEILLKCSRSRGREKALNCHARETFDGPPGSLDERKKKDVIDRTDLRAVLSRENLSVTELNAICREYLKNGITRSHFFQALLQESQDGDVLSKVGLSLWRKILSEVSEVLPNADSAFIIHVLQRTILGRVRIRSVDVDSWLGLFIDHHWLDAFNVVMLVTDAITEWMSSFTQQQVIVPRIVEALQLLAPALRAQNQAIKIGHQRLESFKLDILVLDCCIEHQIPFEIAEGEAQFSLNLWLDLTKKTGVLPSDLGNTLDDPEFGQPVRRALAMWLVYYQFDDHVLELAMGKERLSQVLVDAAADLVKLVVDTDLRNATNHVFPLSKPGIRRLILHDPKLVDLLSRMDFPQLLQRAMQAGVLDEIGWRSFDEAIDAYQPAWVNHYCHVHLHFVFPYVSFIVGSEVVICGPDSYEVRPIPEWLPLTIVRWIIPVGKDVLFIFELPTPPSNLDPSDSEYGIWLSEPDVRKRFPRGQHFARGAILVEISKNRYSLGGRPFRVGQLPIDLPRTCVFAEGDSVWTIHLKPESAFDSEAQANVEEIPLKGCNYQTGERLDARLPEFFESNLLPSHTPFSKLVHSCRSRTTSPIRLLGFETENWAFSFK